MRSTLNSKYMKMKDKIKIIIAMNIKNCAKHNETKISIKK